MYRSEGEEDFRKLDESPKNRNFFVEDPTNRNRAEDEFYREDVILGEDAVQLIIQDSVKKVVGQLKPFLQKSVDDGYEITSRATEIAERSFELAGWCLDKMEDVRQLVATTDRKIREDISKDGRGSSYGSREDVLAGSQTPKVGGSRPRLEVPSSVLQ